jgi:FkbM family methyltransferase
MNPGDRSVGSIDGRAQPRRRGLALHWQRLERSLRRRWREWRLPSGYVRLGTRYGGWWLDRKLVRADPFVVDCGLGKDISFDSAFLSQFGGLVVGIEANPESLAWCREHCPPGMRIVDRAFWTEAGATLEFHLPRAQEALPRGADGVSGSLLDSHEYVGGGRSRKVVTTDLAEVLAEARRADCDVLKLDIEGAEYAVLNDLAARGMLGKCRQLLVEFHHGVTAHDARETEKTVAAILAAGFRLAHVEGRNYIFRRGDLA